MKNIPKLIIFCSFFALTPLANAETLYLLPGISTHTAIESQDNVTTSLSQGNNLKLTINHQAIKQSGAKTVSEIISQVSSVQVYSKTGSSPIFYIHGLRAQVLLNGQPLSGFDSSSAMLNLIPVDAIESITIDTTGENTTSTDGMLGGTINIIMKITSSAINLTTTYPKYGALSASYFKKIDNNNQIGLLQAVNNDYGDRHHDNIKSSQSLLDYKHTYTTGMIDTNLIYLAENSQYPGGLTQSQYDENPNQASSGWEIYKQRSLNMQTNWQQRLNDSTSLNTQLQYRGLNAIGYFPSFNSSFEQTYQTVSLAPTLSFFYSDDKLDKTLSIKPGINYRYQSFVNTASVNQSYRQMIQAVTNANETIKEWQFSQGIGYGFVYDHANFISYDANGQMQTEAPTNQTYYPLSTNLGISYQFQRNLQSGLLFSHDYQLPFIDQSNLTPGLQSNFGLKPQTANTLTLNERYYSLRYPFKITASFYTIWVNNQIAYDPNQPSGSLFSGANVNLPPVFQYGSDLLITFTPFTNLSIGSSVTINIAKFQSGQMADGTSIKGNSVPGVPNTQFEIHSNLLLLKYIHWYLQTLYHGNAYADGDFENSQGKVSPYWLINSALSYQKNSWHISLRVNNLLNQKYNQYVTDINHQWTYYPADGINGALTLTYQFQ